MGTESLFIEASEKELNSRLSLELFLWWRLRRKKLLLVRSPKDLREDFVESSSCKVSEMLRLRTNSSSTLEKS